MGEFKEQIQELVSASETDKAFAALKEQAALVRSALKSDIAVLEGQFKKNQRASNLDLSAPADIQRELNRIHDTIIQYAGQLDAPVLEEPISGNHKHRKGTYRIGAIVLVVFILIFAGWYLISLSSEMDKCKLKKAHAAQTLKLILGKKRSNTDKIDEVKFLFWEGTLQNHVNLTYCDSLDAITRDIEAAKQFLKRYE